MVNNKILRCPICERRYETRNGARKCRRKCSRLVPRYWRGEKIKARGSSDCHINCKIISHSVNSEIKEGKVVRMIVYFAICTDGQFVSVPEGAIIQD